MTLSKRMREQMLAHCGEIHEDDGVDPREFFKTRQSRDNKNRKAIQLCNQVAETLGLVLAGDFDDELLHNLQVVSVVPAPDASQLAVALRADIPRGQVHAQKVLDRLAMVAGRLRCEVAAAITRKRAPKLVFHLIGPEGGEEVQP
ncbi:MAG: ribosome-binding factor A [Planctomycetota bacterium]|nr:MAG: ribosome-binding factor A [Planctomycetota bacterium]REJ91424.1 MAG: ribosome-binding factor A [Planctomycetota bacterium]REK18456.1 MAG: ribosome-binding factor A [Planctomycetota bacterium]REK39483.1 MAG: ribosome-binding factor A [Planctomycetota bacterium]